MTSTTTEQIKPPAEWNSVVVATMTRDENLRNVCRRLEQKYVEWRHRATHRRACIAHSWPAIGELGRLSVKGQVVTFVTTKRRSIQVKDASGTLCGEVKMQPGLAQNLYEIAARVAQHFAAADPDAPSFAANSD